MRSDLIDVEVWIVHETPAAILVSSLDGGDEKVWLPKSAIEIDFYDAEGAHAVVTLRRSLAEEKGLA